MSDARLQQHFVRIRCCFTLRKKGSSTEQSIQIFKCRRFSIDQEAWISFLSIPLSCRPFGLTSPMHLIPQSVDIRVHASHASEHHRRDSFHPLLCNPFIQGSRRQNVERGKGKGGLSWRHLYRNYKAVSAYTRRSTFGIFPFPPGHLYCGLSRG